MAQMMRQCAQCGTLDRRKAWGSADEAARDRAFEEAWTCSSCAWTEFELVEAEAEPAEESRGRP